MEVFVRGFFHVNLGDDLFLYILARRYPQHKFHVIINDEYTNVFRDEKNIIVHSYKKIRRGLDRFLSNYDKDYYLEVEKKCQLNVVIGGSIFQEGLDDANARKRLAKMPNLNPTYILGANFGPYVTEDYRLLVQDYLAKAEDVCFRDKWSKDKFSDLTNVRYAPDIVLGIESIIPKVEVQQRMIFISVIDCLKKGKDIREHCANYENFIVRCINYYSEHGYEIKLSSFCKMEGDEDAISRIVEKLSSEKLNQVSILNYNGDNWREIIDLINQSEKIIASRFHSMILGMVFGGEILPIAYNKKFEQFLNNFSLSRYCLSISELNAQVPEQMEYLVFNNSEEVAKSAVSHFKKLDGLLMKGIQ